MGCKGNEGRMFGGVEHTLSMYKALGSIPREKKKNQTKMKQHNQTPGSEL